LATMRDTTKRRNYSAEAEEFRREHQRHRVWGMTQRHARKLRSIYGHIPSDEELMAAWHDRDAAASASAMSEQANSRPLVRSESTPSMPEQTVPETAVAERGAVGRQPGLGIGAGGQATESEPAVVAAVPVRRAPARPCRNWFRERAGHCGCVAETPPAAVGSRSRVGSAPRSRRRRWFLTGSTSAAPADAEPATPWRRRSR
jgi:hypothetical protein